jgi:hypothetical protein
MNPEIFALAITGAVFAGGAVGLILQRSLPEKYTSGGPRDMIGAVVGLLTLLSALVLGLLIWTAYGTYSVQKAAVQTLAANVLQLDLALEDYGPETAAARTQIKQRVAKTIDQIWGRQESDKALVALNFAAAIDVLHNSDKSLDTFHPSTDDQKQALARARQIAATIGQARLQMAFALTDPVSYPLVIIVVSWAVFLFCGFGLLSKHNPMSFVAVAVGAMAGFDGHVSDHGPQLPVFGTFSRVFRAHRAGARLYEQEVMSRSWTRGGITCRAHNYPFL